MTRPDAQTALAIKLAVREAIKCFAREIIDHPQLLNDPVRVIATLREDRLKRLETAPWAPEPVVAA